MRISRIAFIGGLAASLAFAQNNSQGILRALNAQVLQLRGVIASANGSDQSATHSRAADALAQRQAVLQELMASAPARALELTFPGSVLADLAETFPESAGLLEQHGVFRGVLFAAVEDGVGFTSSQEIRKLQMGSEMADLHSVSQAGNGSQCNQVIAASGTKSGNVIVSASEVVEGTLAGCSTIGAQKIVVIMVEFPGLPASGSNVMPPAVTQDFLRGAFLGNDFTLADVAINRSISDFWNEASDGKTWVNNTGSGALTVLGPFTLPVDATGASYNYCNYTPAFRNASYAAADPYVDYNQYSRVVIVVPHNGSCNGTAGIGTIGCWGNEAPGDGATNISWTWWRADQIQNRDSAVKLATHEMGHNLGMSHSSSRSHGALVVDNVGVAGTFSEYNDLFSTQGNWNFGYYNAPQALNHIGWLSPSNVQTVTGTGVYTIQGYDTRPNGVKALKVARGTGATDAYFYVSYFPDRGNYLGATPNTGVHGGALIHYADSQTASLKTNLLDFSPSGGDFTNPILPLGGSWTDPFRDVQIAVNSLDTANNTMTVTVTFSPPPCTPSNPTVTFLTTNGSTSPTGAANFTVQVLNNDSNSCAVRGFNLAATTAEPSIGLSFSNSTLNIGPGSTANTTLTASTNATPLGTYTIDATATSGVNSGSTGLDASLTVQIVPPAVPTGVSVTSVFTGSGKNKVFQYFMLQWPAVANASSYEYQRCKVSGKGANATCVYGAPTATTLTQIQDGSSSLASGTYRFQVRAVGSTGLKSNWSTAVQATK